MLNIEQKKQGFPGLYQVKTLAKHRNTEREDYVNTVKLKNIKVEIKN